MTPKATTSQTLQILAITIALALGLHLSWQAARSGILAWQLFALGFLAIPLLGLFIFKDYKNEQIWLNTAAEHGLLCFHDQPDDWTARAWAPGFALLRKLWPPPVILSPTRNPQSHRDEFPIQSFPRFFAGDIGPCSVLFSLATRSIAQKSNGQLIATIPLCFDAFGFLRIPHLELPALALEKQFGKMSFGQHPKPDSTAAKLLNLLIQEQVIHFLAMDGEFLIFGHSLPQPPDGQTISKLMDIGANLCAELAMQT